MRKDVVVLFGKPGSGKDTAADYLESDHGFHIIRGDDMIPNDYKETLRLGIKTTMDQRDRTCQLHIDLVREALECNDRVAICFAFTLNRQREMFYEQFPTARFLMMETNKEVLRARLESRPRIGHLITTEQTLSKQDPTGEVCSVPYVIIENNGDLSWTQRQLRETLSLNPVEGYREYSFGRKEVFI